jgi:fructose-1,6-bisphosphatase/inositol monophosphatase family enzyme
VGGLTRGPDIDAVTALIRRCADELILPRFGQLRAEDVTSKATDADPDDLVTVADAEAEERLTAGLLALAPEAPILAEEAAHRDPGLLRLIDGDGPLWLVDPLDGTRNFARGDDRFGTIVAWVVGGQARAGWIVLPARREVFVAEAGSGALLNGLRLSTPQTVPPEPWRGCLYTRFMPHALGELVARGTAGRFDPLPQSGCGAVTYTDLIRGRQDFVVYFRLLPWDHAAPALILTEAGGRAEHADGRPYHVRSADDIIVAARHASIAQGVRDWLSGARATPSAARPPA